MGVSPKIGNPYLFLQPLKLETSNVVHNLGMGAAYQETTFKTKIGGGWTTGASQIFWDSLLISATGWWFALVVTRWSRST